MQKIIGFLILIAAAFGVAELPAQTTDDPRQTTASSPAPTPTDEPRPWQFWIRGQGQHFDNFFQRGAGQPQEDVQAVLGELGASVAVSRTKPLRAYGSVNYVHYDDSRLDGSPGVRLGLRLDGRPHAFNVYAESLHDRPSFEIGDGFDQADIRNLVGDYSFRFTPDWQLSLAGELQEQDVAVTSSRDNDYYSAGAGIRWRRSRYFSPEIGFRTGRRDVADDQLSYDQRERYIQIRSSPTSAVYLSLRFRNRVRDYTTRVPGSSYLGREDDRDQITLTADWTMSPSLTWNFYGSRERADINRPGSDFTSSLYLLGVTWRF